MDESNSVFFCLLLYSTNNNTFMMFLLPYDLLFCQLRLPLPPTPSGSSKLHVAKDQGESHEAVGDQQGALVHPWVLRGMCKPVYLVMAFKCPTGSCWITGFGSARFLFKKTNRFCGCRPCCSYCQVFNVSLR